MRALLRLTLPGLLATAGGLLVACGGSSGPVVNTPTAPPPSTPPTSSAPPTTSAPATTSSPVRHPVLTVTPHSGLRDGQTVLVRATGFSPAGQFTVIECAQKGTATGPGDCNLTGMQAVASDAAGVVQTRLRVVKGPFGANKIVCSAQQACLISVTQASLSPTEEADRVISFAP